MTKPLATLAMIKDHAKLYHVSAQSFLRDKTWDLNTFKTCVAIFDDAKIATFSQADSHNGEMLFRLDEQFSFETGDRIEVRPLSYKNTMPNVINLPSGNTMRSVNFVDAAGYSIVLQKRDGIIARLINLYANDDVSASNLAVRMRQALVLTAPASITKPVSEGFKL